MGQDRITYMTLNLRSKRLNPHIRARDMVTIKKPTFGKLPPPCINLSSYAVVSIFLLLLQVVPHGTYELRYLREVELGVPVFDLGTTLSIENYIGRDAARFMGVET